MRQTVLVFLFGIFATLLLTSSQAFAFQGSSSLGGDANGMSFSVPAGGSGSGSGGGGGIGGALLLNDIEYKSRTFDWTTSLHNDFFASVKKTKTAVSSPAAKASAARNVFFDSPVGNASSVNRRAWNQIAITNACSVPDIREATGWKNGEKCRNINPNTKRLGIAGGWQEIHVDAPGGKSGPAGNPIGAIVRVWRECRGTGGTKDQPNRITGYESKEKCETPILERVLPSTDHNLTGQSPWFYGYGAGDSYKASEDPEKGVAQSPGNYSAGVLYKSCATLIRRSADRALYCGTGPAGGVRGATYKGGSGGYFQQQCSTGSISKNDKWSRQELAAELNARQGKTANSEDKEWFKDNQDKLQSWADTGDISKFPPVANTTTEKKRICNALSEWATINWSILGNTGVGYGNVDVDINGIPGRVYAIQIAIVDRSETILEQKVELLTSPTSVKTPTCVPNPCQPCPGEPKSSSCNSPIAQVPETNSPSVAECDKAILTNEIGSCSITASPDVAPPSEDNDGETSSPSDVDENSASTWFPRSFGGGIYNRQDASKDGWQEAYDKNHPSRSFTNTVGGWTYGNILDSTLQGFVSSDSANYRRVDGMVGKGVLVNDGDRSLSGGYQVSVARATEMPFRDNGYDANTPEAIKEHYRTEDIRYVDFVGESIRPVGQWNKQANTYLDTKRLTSENCQGGAREWAPANGTTGTADWNNIQSCKWGEGGFNDGIIRGSGANAWRVKDAYYLPPTKAGSGYRDLAVSFTQEKTDEAKLSLDSHGTSLAQRVVGIEVYSERDYFEGGLPTYAVAGSDADMVNAAQANGQIRFCPTTKLITVQDPPYQVTENKLVANLAHSQTAWQGWSFDIDSVQGFGNKYVPDYFRGGKAFYDDDRYDGNGPMAAGYISVQPDIQFWKKDGNYYDENPGGGATVAWGRSWWNYYTKKGGKWVLATKRNTTNPRDPSYDGDNGPYNLYKQETRTVTPEPRQVRVPNEDCKGGYGIAKKTQEINPDSDTPQYRVRDDQTQEKLPAGNYVVVYRISFQNGFEGGYWGVNGQLQWRQGKRWANGYTYQSSSSFLPVYDSRPVG